MSANWRTNPTDFVIRLLPTIKSDKSIQNYAVYQLGEKIPLSRIAELRAKHPPAKMIDPGEPIGLSKRETFARERVVNGSAALAQAIGRRA